MATFEVSATTHSIVGGNPLDTRIHLSARDRLVVQVNPNDLWRAGSGPRESNAEGLGKPFGDSFGNYTTRGGSFPYGSLIGQIGENGTFFFVGTSYDNIVLTEGTLRLCFWDSNAGDNSGSVRANVQVNPSSSPTPTPPPRLSNRRVACQGSIFIQDYEVVGSNESSTTPVYGTATATMSTPSYQACELPAETRSGLNLILTYSLLEVMATSLLREWRSSMRGLRLIRLI